MSARVGCWEGCGPIGCGCALPLLAALFAVVGIRKARKHFRTEGKS